MTEAPERLGERCIAALVIAELEHFREGLLRIVLLLGALLCIAAPLALLDGSGATITAVIVAAVVACAGYLAGLRAHTRLFWELGRRPWIVLPVAVLWGAGLAVEGVGSHALLSFPAAILPALPVAVGRPLYGVLAMTLVVVSATAIGFVAHVAALGLHYDPLSAPYVFQSAAGFMFTATYCAWAERQVRHVGATVLCRLLESRETARTEPPSDTHNEPPQGMLPGAPSAGLLQRPSPDIAALARDDLGLTARQMEMMLLSLAGYQEDEIPTRLAHLGGRGGKIKAGTVYRTLANARERIATAHEADYVTHPQAIALLQDALDRRIDDRGAAVTGEVPPPKAEPGRRRGRPGSGRRR